jgi:hypothetical protein
MRRFGLSRTLAAVDGVRSSGENVVIDGYCVSACTIVLEDGAS